jgi:hypothetical protein
MATSLSDHSVGVAKAVSETFFPAFGSNRDTALVFYGEEATLCWQGSDYVGLGKITEFLSAMPPFEIKVTGYEVQTVPGSNENWSMVVVIGNVHFPDGLKNFHSSVYVESDRNQRKAHIRYQGFNFF